MRKLLLMGVAAVAMSTGGAAYASVFPGFHDNPLGPEFLITFNANGSIATALNPVYSTDPGPYDGSDDTYFGVINNTHSTISSFHLTSTLNIGGFDGDGIDHYGAPSNATDTSGYGGPNAFFTNNLGTSLTVNFITPIAANGGTDIFSLELPASLTGTPTVTTGGTPEASTWFMMLAGFAGMGFIAYRKRGTKTALSAA
jgi:PEP-CTERM motif